ncbi:uncharacterized protein LOC21411862 [Morus notabilis]|uniref:uncharacterized protein LOC21411862 n=1 Tax=Morus notabilis TaxID=981085 RepID=UPI000CED44DF|nr:uncharacterized protein LOC21411862 [Morus notabilis]
MRFSYQSRSATAIFWALHFHHHHHSLKNGHFQVSPVPGGGERSAIGQGRVPQDLQDEALGHQRGPCQVKVLRAELVITICTRSSVTQLLMVPWNKCIMRWLLVTE